MSITSLSLPIDIPWRRVCVTDDMNVDGEPCQPTLVTPWRSSIAVSIYEPDKEGQDVQGLIPANPFEAGGNTQRIVYYKVTVTVTPYVPKTDLASTDASNYMTDPKFVAYPQTYPCYGALLQVAVRPQSTEGLPKEDWPYILDCEPKKRELYESVTETGEVMTGSSESLSTTKSGGSSFGLGPILGQIIPIPGGGLIGAAAEKLLTSGTFSSSSSTDETTERSSERRETQGHSTQLSQMYHLFQAFHVGTNRGVFLMEPRPHVVSTPATFLKKPRQLEGIQDIFIAVAKKWDAADEPLCLEVRLDTAHLYDISQQEDLSLAGVPPDWQKEVKVFPLQRTKSPNFPGYFWNSAMYVAPAGYKIYSLKAYSNRGDGQVGANKASDQVYTINWYSTQAYWEGSTDSLDITAEVVLYPDNLTEEQVKETVVGMFLLGRKLCCCDLTPTVEEGVTYQNVLPNFPTTPETNPTRSVGSDIIASRKLALQLRSAILEGSLSPYRKEPGELPFVQSDPFYTAMASGMLQESQALKGSLATVPGLTPTQRDAILAGIGPKSALSFVSMDSDMISLRTGLSVQEISTVKDQVLRSAKPLPTPTSPTAPLRGIIGITLLSSYPNPNYPRAIYKYLSPTTAAVISDNSRVNIIDVTFNGKPDGGTVTASSFYVEVAGAALPGAVQQLNDTSYRLVLTTSLPPGTAPRIVLKGVGASAITFAGLGLGGSSTTAFPTGNGITPDDFAAAVEVIAAQPPAPPAPPPTDLLRVIGVELTTTTGSPHVLATMVTPGALLQVNAVDDPNTVDIQFNNTPTGGTVTTATFLVSSVTGAVAGTVTSLGANTYRFVPSSALSAGDYTVTLVASGITFSGNPLDGDPIALPSGDGVPGTDFTFVFHVN